MSLIATDVFKDLCGDVNDDDDDPEKRGSVFNSLEYQDMNGNVHTEQSDSKDENSIENISDDKLSNGQFSLDVNLSQFERSLPSQVSLVESFNRTSPGVLTSLCSKSKVWQSLTRREKI